MNKDVLAAAAILAVLLPPVVDGQMTMDSGAVEANAPATLQPCEIRVGNDWKSIGYTTQPACFSSIAAYGPGTHGRQFRFATWGAAVLAIDREYRYRSDNNGADWYVVAALDDGDERTPAHRPSVTATATRPPSDPGAWGRPPPSSTLRLTPSLGPRSLQQLRDGTPPR
jgi:hypothetical protein